MKKNVFSIFYILILFSGFLILDNAFGQTTIETKLSDSINEYEKRVSELQEELEGYAKTTLESGQALLYISAKGSWYVGIDSEDHKKIEFAGQGEKFINFPCDSLKHSWLFLKSESSEPIEFFVFNKGKLIYYDSTTNTFNKELSCTEEIFGKDSNDYLNDKKYNLINEFIISKLPSPYDEKWMIEDLKEQANQPFNQNKDQAILLMYTNDHWRGKIIDSGGDSASIERKKSPDYFVFPIEKVPFLCKMGGTYEIEIMNIPYSYSFGSYDDLRDNYFLFLGVVQNGKVLDYKSTDVKNGIVSLSGNCGSGEILQSNKSNNGGCLISTATFGTELAPQVQQLRELRDNYLMKTESGSSFMTGFNQFYYSFSPTIADWERQNPVFKEAVKIGITPLLTSLSILNYVDMDSEAEVLGYGISLILLNIGMYVVAPVGIGLKIVRRKFV